PGVRMPTAEPRRYRRAGADFPLPALPRGEDAISLAPAGLTGSRRAPAEARCGAAPVQTMSPAAAPSGLSRQPSEAIRPGRDTLPAGQTAAKPSAPFPPPYEKRRVVDAPFSFRTACTNHAGLTGTRGDKSHGQAP